MPAYSQGREGGRGKDRAREEAEPEHGLSCGGHSAWCQAEAGAAVYHRVGPSLRQGSRGG